MPPENPDLSNFTGSPLGFEVKLWLAADKLRNKTGTAECKYIVLNLFTGTIWSKFRKTGGKISDFRSRLRKATAKVQRNDILVC